MPRQIGHATRTSGSQRRMAFLFSIDLMMLIQVFTPRERVVLLGKGAPQVAIAPPSRYVMLHKPMGVLSSAINRAHGASIPLQVLEQQKLKQTIHDPTSSFSCHNPLTHVASSSSHRHVVPPSWESFQRNSKVEMGGGWGCTVGSTWIRRGCYC